MPQKARARFPRLLRAINTWDLPVSIRIGDRDYAIRSDYREILAIISYWSNPDYTNEERAEIMLRRFYVDWREMPREHIEPALREAMSFIDMGMPKTQTNKKQTMDWEYDAPIIFPAVNKVLGYEVRAKEYVHWWTFMGAYMEIGEGVFTTVVTIRGKKNKHEKLEKHEKQFYQDNKAMCDLPVRYTQEELEERNKYLAIITGGG